MGEFTAETFMVLPRGGKPHPVIRRVLRPVAEEQNNFVLNIDRQGAEHGPGMERQRAKRLEHELMGRCLARLTREESVIPREGGGIATGL